MLLTLSSNCDTHLCGSCASKPSHCMLLVVDLPRVSHQACDAALSRGDCNFLCDPCGLRICSAYPDQACRTGSETQSLHPMQVCVLLTSQGCNRQKTWRCGGHLIDWSRQLGSCSNVQKVLSLIYWHALISSQRSRAYTRDMLI